MTYADRVRSLRLDDVSAAARKVIRAEQVKWVVAGEASRLAEELRALDFDEIRLLDNDGNRLG